MNSMGRKKRAVSTKKGRSKKVKVLDITESFDLLKKYRIPVADYGIAKTADSAIKSAKNIGYPVVLKAISKKATHKTEAGGLIFDIDSDKEVKAAFDKLKKNMKKVKADFGGVVVQKMIGRGSQEVIIGGKEDPQFGQTIAFGLGGIFVEVFEDVTFRVVPIEKRDAEEMIKEIKAYKVLSGYRGKKYDTKAVSEILMKVSKLLEENKNVVELDINPIMVLKRGAVAVDARVIIENR